MYKREQLDLSEVASAPTADDFDHLLMERLHEGDRDAATLIYVRYAERLLGVARRNTPADLRTRFDPEDVVQSVFRTFFPPRRQWCLCRA